MRSSPRSATPSTCRAAVAGHRPDLVVLDVRMPPTFTDEGTRAAKQIKEQHPELGVLVLSQHVETAHAVELVSQGGFGYLLKNRVLDVGDVPRGRRARGARAAPRSTLRSSRASCRREARRTIRSPRSPSASARCSS